jgi:pimeloyl-ACP methyl ester carboxylesterase
VVFVDQRGTGGSNKLECPIPSDPARQLEDLRSCLAGLDADPTAYTTAWAMDDVDDVRAALGYDKVNVYGGSYGATAAQVYVLRHGDHVRTASLDAGSLLDVPMFERYPRNSQAALGATLARCEADSTCRAEYPAIRQELSRSLRQELSRTLARLDESPLTTSLIDPRTGQAGMYTREMVSVGLHQLLMSTTTAAIIPKAVHLLHDADWAALQALNPSAPSADGSPPAWSVMNLTILCHEDWARTRRAETDSQSAGSYLRYSDVRALTVPEDVCGVVPRPQPAALYGPVTGSAVPVLLVNGEADPQDPPANVAGAKQLYPNSLSLVAPGQSHGYTGVACRASIVADFVERGSVDGLATECLNHIALPSFAR